jgi:hypothetical protein
MKHLKALNYLTHYVLEKAGLLGCLRGLDTTVAANMLTPAQILALRLGSLFVEESLRNARRARYHHVEYSIKCNCVADFWLVFGPSAFMAWVIGVDFWCREKRGRGLCRSCSPVPASSQPITCCHFNETTDGLMRVADALDMPRHQLLALKARDTTNGRSHAKRNSKENRSCH